VTVLFRCDSSASIGAGHVTRCRALALALRREGIESTFLSRANTVVEGFEPLVAPEGADDRLGDDDLARAVEVARSLGAETIVADHYGAWSPYLDGLRDAGLRVGVIGDRADRDLSAADWLLNQNFGAESQEYAVGAETTLMLGPTYALLRPEFAPAHDDLARSFAAEDSRLVVSFGGGTRAAECAAFVRALEPARATLDVRCIAAASSGELEEAAKESRHRVDVVGPVRDMTEHLLWADVSVNAGGSTCWEVLCLGLPMVVMALASDQHGNADALGASGLALAAGSFEEASASVVELLGDMDGRAEMSRAGTALVDGRGAERVAAVIRQRRAAALS
jgi:UDP-2,4-diacetamido-2,4,6-trideoxy-beta-L-altropyranose hydrolase